MCVDVRQKFLHSELIDDGLVFERFLKVLIRRPRSFSMVASSTPSLRSHRARCRRHHDLLKEFSATISRAPAIIVTTRLFSHGRLLLRRLSLILGDFVYLFTVKEVGQEGLRKFEDVEVALRIFRKSICDLLRYLVPLF